MSLFRIIGAGISPLVFMVFFSLPVYAANSEKPAAPAKPAASAKAPETAKPAEPAKGGSPAVSSKSLAPVKNPAPVSALPSSSVAVPNLGGRSPFGVPQRYTSAVQSLVLRGVVRTDQYSGAIVQVAEAENLVVLKVGSRLKLDIDDQRYEFRLTEIKEKSVVFKGRDDRNYEVPIQ